MENIAGRILFFHNLYRACMAGTVFFLIVSVILFVRLNIREAIGLFTGWQAKHEVRKLEETGRKRNRGEKYIEPGLRQNLGLRKSGELEIRKVEDFTEVTITKRLADGSGEETELLQFKENDSEKTTLLHQEELPFFIEREILLIHTDEIIV